jgi:hypothetical protein
MKASERYEAIDIHNGSVWPDPLPTLTEPEAIRAAKRLWRWAEGSTLQLPIVITSGNRYNWTAWEGHQQVLRVNPSAGWPRLAHDLSHLFWRRANPGARPHEKGHARFEAKLIKEILKRGYLNGALRDAPKADVPAEALSPEDAKLAVKLAELARIEAAIDRWSRKAERARRAMNKLEGRRKYYARKVAAVVG